MAKIQNKICPGCNKVFKTKNATTCSDRCRMRMHRAKRVISHEAEELHRAKQALAREATALKKSAEHTLKSTEETFKSLESAVSKEVSPDNATEEGFIGGGEDAAPVATAPRPAPLTVRGLTGQVNDVFPRDTLIQPVQPVDLPQPSPVKASMPSDFVSLDKPSLEPPTSGLINEAEQDLDTPETPPSTVPTPGSQISAYPNQPAPEEANTVKRPFTSFSPRRWGALVAAIAILFGVILLIPFHSKGGQNNPQGQSSLSADSLSAITNSSLPTDINGGTLNINRDTLVALGKSLTTTGTVTLQNSKGATLFLADPQNSKVGINTAPTGNASLQVGGDIQASGALAANGGSTSVSNSGLRINNVLVCTSAGCNSTVTTRLPSNATLQGNTFNGRGELVQLTASGVLPALSAVNLFNVNASTLQGNGAAYFTNASHLSSGTLSDLRLSANVTLQGNTFNGASQLVQLTAGGVLPVLSGINLTSLDASNISLGTLANARLSTNVTIAGNTFNGVNQLVQLDGSGYLPALNGSALTNLNASNISSGTLADIRLSANVALLNGTGPQTFSGNNQFTGTILSRNASNSTSAFQIQNSAGTSNLFVADTTNSRIGIGKAPAQGTLDVNGIIYQNGNTVCDSSGNCAGLGTASFISQGGNTFSTDVTIGTNDNYGLNLKTNNTTVASFSNSGAALFKNASNSVAAFSIQDSIGTNLILVDTTNGTVTIAGLQGSGAGLTSLNASNISSGTLDDARLNTDVTIAGNTFNGASQLVQLTAGGVLPVLSGINLTNLDASNVSLGTLANARLSNSVTLQGNTFNGISQLVQLDGSGLLPALNGSALTALNASNISSGTLDDARLNTDVTRAGNTFNGISQLVQLDASGYLPALNGSALTSLNATNISSGTLNDSRLSANVALLDTSQTFSGANLFKNASNSVAAFQIQNAAGSSNLFIADTTNTRIAIGQASATYTLDVNGDINTTGTFRINGTEICTSGGCAPSPGSGDYVSLQSSTPGTPQTGNFNISGAAIAGSFSGSGSSLTSLNATNISSGTLNDSRLSANVALLNGTGPQTFSGNNKFSGTVLSKNTADSLTAFQIQNATGNEILTVDTSGSRVALGKASTLTGVLAFYNALGSGGVGVQAANPGASTYTITLPAETGTVCTTGSLCSGYAASAGSDNYVQLQGSTPGIAQTGNFNISGAAIAGSFSGSGSSLTSLNATNISSGILNDARLSTNVTVQGNTFNGISQLVQLDASGYLPALNGSALTSLNATNISSGTLNDSRLSANVALLDTSQTFSGANLFKNASNSVAAFQIQNAAGSSNLFIADTTNTRIGIGLTSPQYTLDVAGDINATGTYRVAGVAICSSGGCTPSAGSNNYVQIQAGTPGTAQTGNFNISGTGIAGTLQTSTLDTASAGALAIGNTNATSVSICNSANCDTISIGTNADADAINIGDGLDTLTLQGNSSSTIVLNGTTISATELNLLDAHDVALVDTNDAVATAITGTGALNAGSITSGFGSIDTGADNITTTGTVNGNNLDRSTAGALAIGNTTANAINIGNATNNITTQVSGLFLAKPTTGHDSTTVFQIQNAAGNSNLFIADSTNTRIGIGLASPQYTMDVAGDVNVTGTYRIAGVAICSSSGCAPTSGSNNYVQIQAGTPGTAQTGNFNISGTGIASILQAATFDTASGVNLSFGQTNATAINLGNTTNNIITTANGLFVSRPTTGHDSATAFQIQNAAGSSNLLIADTVNTKIGIATAPTSTGSTVQVAGNISTTTGLVLAATGNSSSTISKSMIVSTAVNANDVVVIDTTNAGQVMTTNIAGSNKVFGIATTTNVSPGVAQNIVIGGVYQVNADSNDVSIGDLLITSPTTAGQVRSSNANSTGSIIGRALSAKITGSPGLVWVQVAPGANSGDSSTAIGTITPFAGATTPAGWLVADGSSVSRASYPTLFSALVTNKGSATISNASPAVVTKNGHGLLNGDHVFFETTGALPAGLSADTTYCVLNSATNTFNVSAYTQSTQSCGASAINTTNAGSGVHTLYYAPYGVPDASNFYLPDLRGRAAIGVNTANSTVAAMGSNENVAIGSRQQLHKTSVQGDPTYNLSNVTATVNNTTVNVNSQPAVNFGASMYQTSNEDSGYGLCTTGCSGFRGRIMVNGGSPNYLSASLSGGSYSLASNVVNLSGNTINRVTSGTYGVQSNAPTDSGAYVATQYIIKASSATGSGTGDATTLQGAYDMGSSITTTDARDINFTLADTATDSNFVVNAASGSTGKFKVQNNGTDIFTVAPSTSLITFNGNIVANGAATATTATTSGTGTNTTTLTFTGTTSFANNDVLFIDNAGQDYYTRIVSGGTAASVTVSPAVTFETARTVTKYTVQNIGATSSDYTTQANRFFQGYFLGGIVTGAGSTSLSDGLLQSSGTLNLNASSVIATNSADSATAFQVQKAGATDTLFTANTTSNRIQIGNSTGTDTATTLLVLDGATADPTTNVAEGAMYFNSSTHKYRCYSNSAWADCGSAGNAVLISKTVSTNVASGDLVVIDTANPGQVKTTSVMGATGVYGVSTETKSATQSAIVATAGETTVNVDTAAVAIGDWLVASSTTGRATASSSPSIGTTIGRAMSSKAAGSNGTVTAQITPGAGGSNGSGTPTQLNATADTTQACTFSTNCTYDAMSITLTPGTWVVDGFATLYSTSAADTMALALYNVTDGAEVSNSRSGAISAPSMSYPLSFSTESVVTVTANKVIKLYGLRNGASTINWDYSGAGLPNTQRLTAYLVGSGTGSSGGSGAGELAYNQFISSVSVTGVVQASAQTIITSSSFNADGNTPVIISFYAPSATPATGGNSEFDVWDGSTDVAHLLELAPGPTYFPVSAQIRLTPTAGTHTYSIRGWLANSASATTIQAGDGTSGHFAPGFIRITPAQGSGNATTLQGAYDMGRSITTTDTRDISFTLADTTTDSNFIVNVANNSTSKSAFQYNGADVFSISNAASSQGSALFKNAANNATAFQVQNVGGVTLLGVNTSTGTIFSGVASGGTGFTLNTTNSFASGNLLVLQNNGTPKFTIDSDGNITSNSVGTAAIQDGAVTASKIANGAVAGVICNGSAGYCNTSFTVPTAGNYLISLSATGPFSCNAPYSYYFTLYEYMDGNSFGGIQTYQVYNAAENGIHFTFPTAMAAVSLTAGTHTLTTNESGYYGYTCDLSNDRVSASWIKM